MIRFIELVPEFLLNKNYEQEKEEFIKGNSMCPPEQYKMFFSNREIEYDFPHAILNIKEEIKVMSASYEVVSIEEKEFSLTNGLVQKVYIKKL